MGNTTYVYSKFKEANLIMHKCDFCGVENNEVILDRTEYVCSDITSCNNRIKENAKVLARKFLNNELGEKLEVA